MEKISESIVSNFFGKKEKSDERDILIFGVQRFLEDITKIVFITAIAILLHIAKEIFIVFTITLVYKNFVGGAHAKTNTICAIFTALACFLPIYLTKFFQFSNSFLLILTILTIIFSTIIIIKFAPADTENVPIINKEQRRKLKIGAFISLALILTLSGIIIHNMYYYQIILICLNLSNLNTTPIMYKFFKCNYSGGKITD